LSTANFSNHRLLYMCGSAWSTFTKIFYGDSQVPVCSSLVMHVFDHLAGSDGGGYASCRYIYAIYNNGLDNNI